MTKTTTMTITKIMSMSLTITQTLSLMSMMHSISKVHSVISHAVVDQPSRRRHIVHIVYRLRRKRQRIVGPWRRRVPVVLI